MKQYNVDVSRTVTQKATVLITANDETCARRGVQAMIDFYPHEIAWTFYDEHMNVHTTMPLTDEAL